LTCGFATPRRRRATTSLGATDANIRPSGALPWGRGHADPPRPDLSASDSDLIHIRFAGRCPTGPSRGRDWPVSGRRLARAKPQVTGAIGVSDPYKEIRSFNERARFLPKWHDLCERTLGRQLEAAPDLERLHALRDGVAGFSGPPERLDRRSPTPPLEVPELLSVETGRWAARVKVTTQAEVRYLGG
jgi:hypothetical protein